MLDIVTEAGRQSPVADISTPVVTGL